MTRYVESVSSPSYASVQAASAEELRLAAVAVLGAIPGGNTVTALTLSGASDATFNVLIEHATLTTGLDPAALATAIRFATGASSAAVAASLAAAKTALATANPADYRYDIQVAGATAGRVFMGMLVWAPPGASGGSTPLTQSGWYVNSVTGDDGNDGASAPQSLRTLAELYRRTQGRVFANDATFWLTGDFSAEQLVLSCMCAPGVALDVRGTMIVSLANGSVSAFADYNGGTSTPSLLTDDNPVDFSLLVNQFIRMTSGAAFGYTAPILKSIGAGQCRPGFFMEQGGTRAIPGAADTYVVEEFGTTLGGVDFGGVTGNGGDENTFIPRILFRDVEILTPGQDLVFGTGTNIGVYVYRVRMGDGTWPANITASVVNLVGCLNLDMLTIDQTASVFLFGHADAGYFNILGGNVFNAAIAGGGGLLHQGPYGGLTVGGGRFVTVAQDAYFESENGACLTLEQGGFYSASQANGVIWGANNVVPSYGIRVFTGSTLEYVTKPTVTATADTLIGGTAKTYAQIPYFEATNGAAIVARA